MKDTKLPQASKTDFAFVVRFIPFVGHTVPYIRPLVDNKPPLVGKGSISGFTLTELIITLTVAGVLVALAAPNVSTFLHSNRLVAATNDFVGDLNAARSEARKRGSNAIVCSSGSGITCTGGAWNQGWIIFADMDNTSTLTASDVLIRTHEALAAGTTITSSSTAIIYDRQGQVPTTGADVYTFCNTALRQTRTIALSVAGRHTITPGAC